MDLLNMNSSQLAGIEFDCTCGKRHKVDIQNIIIEPGALSLVPEIVREQGAKRLFLIADQNTWQICGEHVAGLLRDTFQIHQWVLQRKHDLIPDETALGELIAEVEPNDDLLLAIGSGTLNDLTRMISYKTKIPYISIPTAASMDGYASTLSPLILGGKKITRPGVYPSAIIADTTIIKKAPLEMTQAGFGDILGKYTARADWILTREINGDYYCEQTAALTAKAVQKCMDSRHLLKNQDETSVAHLMEALILSGIAMGLVGISRPASGAEHHFSHYWEIDALARGTGHPLHGNSVGAATVIVASVYELMRDQLPAACVPPDPQEMLEKLKSVGNQTVAELGISRDLFIESVKHAKEVRKNRYSILDYADRFGRLDNIAETLVKRFYD